MKKKDFKRTSVLLINTDQNSLYKMTLWGPERVKKHAMIKPRCVCCLTSKLCLTPFAIPWPITHQAPLSMRFFKQEYWSGCHFLLQGIFPTQGLNSVSCVSRVTCIARGFFTTGSPRSNPRNIQICNSQETCTSNGWV